MDAIVGYAVGYQHLAPVAASGLIIPTAWPPGVGDPSLPFKGVKAAWISISVAVVNMRDDGVAPTTAVGGGFPLPVGFTFWYDANLHNIQFISATGLVDVLYYA